MEEFTWENPDILETESGLTDDAVPLCPHCLEPCDPRDNYCPKCGSNEPINPLASYLPFESIRFRAGMFGKLWHKAWDSNTTWGLRCLYVGVFILFMPFVFLMLAVCAQHQFLFRQMHHKDIPSQNAE